MAFHQPQDDMHLTEAEYLATELGSAVKREYIDGKVYAMAGADYNHNCIASEYARLFGPTGLPMAFWTICTLSSLL